MDFPAAALVARKVQDMEPGSLLTMNGNWWLRVDGFPSRPSMGGVVQLVGPNVGLLTPISASGRYLGIPQGQTYRWTAAVIGPTSGSPGGIASAALTVIDGQLIIWGASSPEFFAPYSLEGRLLDDSTFDQGDGIRFPRWKAVLVTAADPTRPIADIFEIDRRPSVAAGT